MTPPEVGASNQAPQQAAAIPFRRRDGTVEFCLITTVKARRWSIPKGFIDPGESATEAALKEAYEEAGLHGRVVGGPVGYYDTSKEGARYTVAVYLMEVHRVDDEWQEQGMRRRRWTSAQGAARRLDGRPMDGIFRRALARISS